eukprot:TRINITY_DN6413_c0_g1_i4.p1 TRINITY_DN6413_c0_g1~~TRINITY_DN6413_c0_g1_i4.p1  ORF type:complete len:1066 (-),score=305.05 TRINITY_DN6413_c0_g1_i4:10-3207(-)
MNHNRSVVIQYEVTIKSIKNVNNTVPVRVLWQTGKLSGKTKSLKQSSEPGVVEFKKEVLKWENTVFIKNNTPDPVNMTLTIAEKSGTKYLSKGKVIVNLNENLKLDGWRENLVTKDFTIVTTSSKTSSTGSTGSPETSRQLVVSLDIVTKHLCDAQIANDEDDDERRGRSSKRASLTSSSGSSRSSSRSSSKKRSESTTRSKESFSFAGTIGVPGPGATLGALVADVLKGGKGKEKESGADEEEMDFMRLAQQQLQEIKNQEDALRDAESENAKLKQLAELAERNNEGARKDRDAYRRERDILLKEKQELTKKIESLERLSKHNTNAAAEQATQRLEQQLKLLTQQLDLQKQEVQNKEQAHKSELQKQKRDAQIQAVELQGEIQKEKQEAQQAKQETQKIRLQMSQLQQELQQQKNEVQRQKQESQQLKSLLDSQGRGNEDFLRIQKQKETDFRAQIATLTAENTSLNSQISELRRNQVQASELKIAELTRDKVALETKLAQVQKTCQLAVDQVQELEREKVKLKQLNSAQALEINRAKQTEKQLEALVGDLQKTKLQVEQSKKVEEARQKEKEAEVNELKKERDGYMQKLTDGDKELSSQIQSYITQIKAIQERAAFEKGELIEQLTEAKVTIQRLEREIERKKVELAQLGDQWQELVDDAKSKNEKLKRTVKHLEIELAESQEQYFEMIKQTNLVKKGLSKFKDKKAEDVLAGLTFDSFNQGEHTKVDKRTEAILVELLSGDAKLDQDSIENFIFDVRAVAQKSRKKPEMAFWIKQLTFIVDSFLEKFPGAHAIPGYSIAIYGIKVVGASDDGDIPPKTKFVHELIDFLYWIHQKYTDSIFEDARDFILTCTFPFGKLYTDSDAESETSISHSDDTESSSESSSEEEEEGKRVPVGKILGIYQKALNYLQEWNVEKSIILQVFNDLFQKTDVHLFNHLLTNSPIYTTVASAKHVQDVLGDLQHWKITHFKGYCDEFSLNHNGVLEYMNEASNLMLNYKQMPREKDKILSQFPHLSLNHIQHIISCMKEEKEAEKQTKYMVLGMLVGWGVTESKVRDLLLATNN